MAKGTSIPKFEIGQVIDPDEVNQAIKNSGTEEGLRPFDDGGIADTDGVQPIGDQTHVFGDGFLNKNEELNVVDVTTNTIVNKDTWFNLLKKAGTKITKEASESITLGDVVSLDSTDHTKCVQSDSSDADEASLVIGIADNSGSATDDIVISTDYYDLGVTAYAEGDVLFLSSTGGLTDAPIVDGGASSGSKEANLVPVAYVYFVDASSTKVILNCFHVGRVTGDEYKSNIATFTNCSAIPSLANKRLTITSSGAGDCDCAIYAKIPMPTKRSKIVYAGMQRYVVDEPTTPYGAKYRFYIYLNGSSIAVDDNDLDTSGNVTMLQFLTSFTTTEINPSEDQIDISWWMEDWSSAAGTPTIGYMQWAFVVFLDVEKLARYKDE